MGSRAESFAQKSRRAAKLAAQLKRPPPVQASTEADLDQFILVLTALDAGIENAEAMSDQELNQALTHARNWKKAAKLAFELRLPAPAKDLSNDTLVRLGLELKAKTLHISLTGRERSQEIRRLIREALHDFDPDDDRMVDRAYLINKSLLKLIPAWWGKNPARLDDLIRKHQEKYRASSENLRAQQLNRFFGNKQPDRAPAKILRLIAGFMTDTDLPEEFRLLTADGEEVCHKQIAGWEKYFHYNPDESLRREGPRRLMQLVAELLNKQFEGLLIPPREVPISGLAALRAAIPASLPLAAFVVDHGPGKPPTKCDQPGTDT